MKNKGRPVFLGLLMFGLLLYGCGRVITSTAEPLGYSTVAGILYAADLSTPVGGARVWTSNPDIETTSRSDGSWTLSNIPHYTTYETKAISVESGSWRIDFLVTPEVGQTVSARYLDTIFSDNNLLEPVDLAVIKGTFDLVEDFITGLGYGYASIEVSDLDNYDNISTFEAIFIDSGADSGSLSSAGETNLKRYVEEAGGCLYVSDLAAGFVEKLWPGAIDFYGTAGNSETAAEDTASAQVGLGNLTVEASVTDQGIRDNVLDKSAASIFYERAYWVVMVGEGTGTEVLLRGTPEAYSEVSSVGPGASKVRAGAILNVSGSPLAVRFSPAGSSGGTVIYTTFHNNVQPEMVSEDAKTVLKHFIMQL